MTIRVNPREINFQSEVRDDGKRIFESGIKYRQEHQQ